MVADIWQHYDRAYNSQQWYLDMNALYVLILKVFCIQNSSFSQFNFWGFVKYQKLWKIAHSSTWFNFGLKKLARWHEELGPHAFAKTRKKKKNWQKFFYKFLSNIRWYVWFWSMLIRRQCKSLRFAFPCLVCSLQAGEPRPWWGEWVYVEGRAKRECFHWGEQWSLLMLIAEGGELHGEIPEGWWDSLGAHQTALLLC